ncbi:ZIP family metal transporter [Methylococcus geothermalis]|uniref:ZIP family metal transporter n=1 Tax=Methylococcus geothermalis TaxID=2681310 RepID=A0A858Q9Z3_9GAMM|nr:ZIP family metal transporter [Methylococcus geothermalis]QJD30534.1 ZIP family metal transporter [Methylococcus geothermalis]
MLFWIILFCLLGGIGGVVAASRVLALPEALRKSLLPLLLSYATGTLLGTAFLGLLPESLELAKPMAVSTTVLVGILIFFLLEKCVISRHCHAEVCEVHGQAGPLILIGDALHNFVDGFVIAAAFLTSFPLGVAAALAVFAHEVPQEVGDFAILLDSGYSTRKAFLYNLLSALAILPGAVVAYASLAALQAAVPYVLALSAASFMYIAMADLLPSLHRYVPLAVTRRQLLLMLAGIGTIAFFHLFGLG